MKTLSLLLLLLTLCLGQVLSARILGIFAISGRSHMNAFNPLLVGLAKRGHQVDVVTAYKNMKDQPNLKTLELTDVRKMMDELGTQKLSSTEASLHKAISGLTTLSLNTCEKVFAMKEFQQLIDPSNPVDLVIISPFMNDCYMGVIHKLKVPFISISPTGLLGWLGEMTGNPEELAYAPNQFFASSDRMTFQERLKNWLGTRMMTLWRDFIYFPAVEEVVRRHFGNDLPPLMEIEKNVSMVFINQHVSIGYPRPYVPAIVEIGGMHCRPAKPLPEDLKSFLDGSGEHGAIFFSMGSNLRSSTMPKEQLAAILGAFRRLPQRILWKWETEEGPEGLPANVKTSKWLPQQDVLGHPKIRLFITHGGQLSTEEATYHGVPLVGIPIYGDQSTNMMNVEVAGYGLKLDFKTLTEDKLYNAITQVLDNPSFTENVKLRSAVFRDQPEHPLDRAIFWTEYVIKHNGARHLRSAALDLSWYQLNLLDVISFVVLVVSAILVLIFFGTRFVLRSVCRKKNEKKPKKE